MTGTADTEAAEFHSTYKLDVIIIPTNKPIVRADDEDVVYKTEREKFTAVINEIIEHHERGQPGPGRHHQRREERRHRAHPQEEGASRTTSSTPSTTRTRRTSSRRPVARARSPSRPTWPVAAPTSSSAATRRCSRSSSSRSRTACPTPSRKSSQKLVDEVRGAVRRSSGDEVVEAGGLHIVGTERHESRRIDNQLRGRAGRQGDPGSSRFYLSLEDDLMRIFAGDRVKNLMERMGMPDDEPIEHPWVTKSVENAQQKVEERNFDIRKNLLEYDDVMSAQRKTVYTMRQQLLDGRYAARRDRRGGQADRAKRSDRAARAIVEDVAPRVRSCSACSPRPAHPRDKDGRQRRRRTATRRRSRSVEDVKLVELDAPRSARSTSAGA